MTVGCGGGVSGAALGERVAQLAFAADMINLELAKAAAAFAETNEYDEQGFERSPGSRPTAICLAAPPAIGSASASSWSGSGRAERHWAWEIGFAHFVLIARTAAAVGERLDEARLLRKAKKLSVARFRNACMHARHAADPEGYVNEEKEGVEARSLTLTTADDGVVLVQGILDKIGGAALRSVLEPLAKRAGKDDDRRRDRRLADALVDVCMNKLDNGVPSQRTHMQVTTSLETLLGLCGAPAAEMEFTLPISAKAVERLACDSSVTRILLDSESMVIDVGRAKRVISGPQAKALKVRDRGCVWPGCDRPATWTSGHHLVHWIHNGPTDLTNLCLLCYRHHWMVHEGGWQIVRADGGQMLTIPPMFGPLPRGPD